jgi:cell division protein FtsL
MAANRIKSENSLQFRKLGRWLAVCAVLTALGLVFVFQRISIHQLSEEIDGLESSLTQVQQKNSVFRLEIEKQKSPEELQDKVAFLGLRMIEMSDPSIDVIESRVGGQAMVADRRSAR